MAWTAPRTWVTGEVVTAALMNTHVRDNLLETAVAKASAKGGWPLGSAANALTELAVGANGASPVAASGETTGVKWGGVETVKESGGTALSVGAVADGEFVKRSGTSLVGTALSVGLTWVGGDSTERTTATGSQVDLVTISSLSIAQTSPILVTLSWRKTTGAAVGTSLGLKLNTTEVRGLFGLGVSTDTADKGTVIFWVNAVVAANQGQGLLLKTSEQGGGSNLNDVSTARPAATITSVVIIASSTNALVTLAVDEVHVYTLGSS